MNLLERIEYTLEKTDYKIIHNFQEVTEVDFDLKEIYFLHGDSEEIKGMDESDFKIIEYEKMDYPENIFETVKLLKKIIKDTESDKLNMFIEIDGIPYFGETEIEEFCQMDEFIEKIGRTEFYRFRILKNFLLKKDNFKSQIK